MTARWLLASQIMWAALLSRVVCSSGGGHSKDIHGQSLKGGMVRSDEEQQGCLNLPEDKQRTFPASANVAIVLTTKCYSQSLPPRFSCRVVSCDLLLHMCAVSALCET
jgi:hypothetical protein